jgi:hypothetical protein
LIGSAIRIFATAAGLLSLCGCVPSLHPLYTESDRTTESDLLGTWSQADTKDIWEFESSSDESYILTYTEKGVAAKFQANLVQLGDYLFLDLYPAEEADVRNDLMKLHLVPAHTFARLNIKEDTLEIAMVDNDWLRGKLTRKELSIPHQALVDGVVLTASTKELQAFVTKVAAIPEAFAKPTILKRAE